MKPCQLLCNIFSLFTLLVSSPAFSQNTSEFDQWKQGYLKEYENYKDEIDREFAQFLKLDWKKFDTRNGIKRDPVPKPISIPRDKPAVTKTPKPVAPESAPITITKIEPITLPRPTSRDGVKVSLKLLGHKLEIFVKLNRKFAVGSPLTHKGIQAGFDILAKSDYENLIVDLKNIESRLKLNDWAYIQLVKELGHAFMPDSKNSARLLSWFLLLKSGIKSRIAFADNELYLLTTSRQPLYDIPYFNFSRERFYVISGQKRINSALYSYNGAYPKKLPTSDFSRIGEILTREEFAIRKVRFNYGDNNYDLRIPVNRHVIDFFSTYPQMDIKHYFNAVISADTQQALLSQLRPLVEQLSQQDAVNFLLRLVQTGFDYQTDEMQFGRENYLFLEETIFYPASDCEDRSILFAWLVEKLLGLSIIGLDFPGHIATAVRLDRPAGTPINHNGKVYTIADPTYINASVGSKMPQYRNVAPKVINYHQ